MPTYSDYFSLREGYHPVISKISITDPQNRWKDTYPHQTFVELLKKTEKMLGRAQNNDKKPIWIEGAYGTGKSRIAWTLGELLTCSANELTAYFNEYEELRREQDLCNKLLGHKQGDKIVVATRYSSSEIDSMDALIMAVYDSVNAALEKAGLETLTGQSLRGGIIKWLEPRHRQNYLTDLLAQEPWRGKGSCGNLTGEEVRRRLQEEGEHRDLLLNILAIARQEHINAISFDMEALCNWLTEIIAINQLKALVFIWDEFSDFFKKNMTNLGTFQELAHLSDSTPFYLLIVTHFSRSILPENDQSARIVIDRFNKQLIELPDYTAFKLIGYALKVKEAHKEEWAELREDLNSRLEEARRAVSHMIKGLDQEDFKRILPVHPFAALVLKNVATLFDSNQRSMFQFIALESEDMHAFQWFTKTFTPEEKEFLSVDRLWDYFYKTGRGASGSLGRDNLDLQVRDILDAYPPLGRKYAGTNATGREEDTLDQRVLKTIIILQALSKKMPSIREFRATEETLRVAFNGLEGLENGVGLVIADRLVQEKTLFIDNGVYQVPMGLALDQSAIQDLESNVRNQLKTKDLIKNFKAWELLPPDVALEKRFSLELTSHDSFRPQLNKLIAVEVGGYRMKALMVFARNPWEAAQVRKDIAEALADPRASGILYIDASDSQLPESQLDAWITARARALYFNRKDDSQQKNAEQLADNLMQEWASDIRDKSFRLWSTQAPNGRICQTGEKLNESLKDAVRAKYPTCFDYTNGLSEALFNAPNIKIIKAGLEEGYDGRLTCQHRDILLNGVKGVPEYWKANTQLWLSQLKTQLERLTGKAFASGGEGRIAIGDLVDFLIGKGFMPTALSAYLTAFLLKEYASSTYRYSDGQTGDSMNSDKLAEMINGYYRKLNGTDPRYHEQYIEVLTKEQRAFVDLAQNLFHVQPNASLETIARQIASKVRDFGYPLWCLEALTESVGLEEFIEKFGHLLNPAQITGATCGSLATDIGRLFMENPDILQRLKMLFSRESLENAMQAWLESFNGGEFQKIAQEIHALDPLGDVRRCFSADGTWLWDKQTGVQEISKVFEGYQLTSESVHNGFLTSANSLESCYAGWQEKVKQIRIPCETLMEKNPDLKPFLRCLKDIAQKGKIEQDKRQREFYEFISQQVDRIRDLFNNCRYFFQSIYKEELHDLSELNKEELYNRLDMTSFQRDKAEYENLLHEKAEELRGQLLRNRLHQLWREKTGTDSPSDWSTKQVTPLKAVLQLMEMGMGNYTQAVDACTAIERSNTSEREIGQALSFWQQHDEIFSFLAQNDVADRALREKIIGHNFLCVLEDLLKVRAVLKEKLGGDIHAWLDNPSLHETIRTLAYEEFQQSGKEKIVNRKIDAMAPEEAKKYLKQLVQREFEVGIKILAE